MAVLVCLRVMGEPNLGHIAFKERKFKAKVKYFWGVIIR